MTTERIFGETRRDSTVRTSVMGKPKHLMKDTNLNTHDTTI